MHYIRLLRAPKLTFQNDKKKNPWSLNVVLTVTTDLGDSFLAHDEPVPIKIKLGWEHPRGRTKKSEPMTLAGEKVLNWTSGMRILKADFPAQHLEPTSTLPTGNTSLRVHIEAGSGLSADTAADIAMAGFNGEEGKVVPLWADVDVPLSSFGPRFSPRFRFNREDPRPTTTCFRRLRLGREHWPCLEVEEDVGESIARHVWDAGMLVVSRLWLMCNGDSGIAAGHPVSMSILQSLLLGDKSINILELGCGVGVFGIGLAHMIRRGNNGFRDRANVKLVLTDLPEAEERVRSNLDILASKGGSPHEPEFEDLDWDYARKGSFGSFVEDEFWDLVVLSDCTYNADALPALVDTWTAIHKQNNAIQRSKEVVTRVLVAMKVRHADEDRLWELVKKGGWTIAEQAAIPLPMLGGESQEIFLYLFENKRRVLPSGYVS